MHCVIVHTNINFKTQQEFFPLFLLLLVLGEYLHTTRWLNLPYARKIKLNWAKWTPTNAWKYSYLFHLEKVCKKYFVRAQFYVLKSFSPPPSPPNKESCRPQLCCQCTGISWSLLVVFCYHRWDSISMFCSLSISEWHWHFPQAQFCPKYVKIFITWAGGELLVCEGALHVDAVGQQQFFRVGSSCLTSLLVPSRRNPLPEPGKGELKWGFPQLHPDVLSRS